MTFNSFCRLCATMCNEVDLVDIFGNKNDLESKIELCFRLKIENDNYLPKQACIVCSSKVHSYYDFFLQVQKAQLVFKSNEELPDGLVDAKIEADDQEEIDEKFDVSFDKFSGNQKCLYIFLPVVFTIGVLN